MTRPAVFLDRPLIPIVDPLPDGDFLLPVCLNADEFQSLLSALHGYQNLSADYDPATYQRVLEAWEAIRLSCNAEDGPPYWSSVDDAEGDFSYGELSGWDRFGTWLVTGFMMYLTSPVGGLVFRHYATRVQLRYRQDGWGGVFRVLINGIEIDEVDTSGVTAIKELIYDLSDILGLSAQQVEPYTLTLERIDTDPARMIALYRGYIHAPEVETDTSNWVLNWNADLGTVELRRDGVTVDDVDVYDIVKPVWDDVVTPPPYTAPEPVDIPCSAATRAANDLRTLVWEPLYNRHQQATGFITWVFATFSDIVQNPIAAISSGLYGELWTALNNGISLDSDDWEYVRCVFYRHLPASGLFDDDTLSDIASELIATSDAKFIALAGLITAMRWNGINYIERVDPDGSTDCDGCTEVEYDWYYSFDFRDAPHGWDNITDSWLGNSSWVSGVGWQQTSGRGLRIGRGTNGTKTWGISAYRLLWSHSGTPSTWDTFGLQCRAGSSFVAIWNGTPGAPGDYIDMFATGDENTATGSNMWLSIDASSFPGYKRYHKLEIWGFGDSPDW